ncbi:VOC family protein [Streptomyces sp. CA-250714]|uniref:VOC family protein n=1 Tax=Streptomyces sp. CA-250714 TaxID=3240060 RepID=UPI003D8B5430
MSTSHACSATVGWFEITATDPSLSQSFYEGLFGWSFDSFGGEDSYRTITAPGAGTSMGALRRGDRDALCIGVVCSDAAATVRRLESLGAVLSEPPERTPAGDIHAVVTDVRGNRLGLFEPAGQGGAAAGDAAPVLNSTAFFEIGTNDLAATQEFYKAAFGWTTERDAAAEGVAYYSVLLPDASAEIGGVLDLSEMDGRSDYAIPGLYVSDIEELLERSAAAGGRRVMGPVSDANGIVVGQFLDPVGNRWSAFTLPSSD